MASVAPSLPIVITVKFETRPGGGLRAWSDDLPGFVLSHSDANAVLADVEPVLSVMLSELYGRHIRVERAETPRDEAEPVMPAHLCGEKPYVGLSNGH